MRILSLIAVVLFVSSLAAPARAGIVEDCVQTADWNLKISGCTEVIRSGQYSGKDLVRAYNNRGNAYANLGNPARAIKDYDQALRLNPGFIKARANRGIVYNGLAWDLYLKGRNAQALDNADRSLSDRPDSAAAINTRAHVLAALGRRNEALGAFERVMRVGGADWVRTYQEALAKHGYYPGAIYGGAYGPQTRAALVACLDAGCRLLE
jgi:tetratricopeptide (TPR) repeat protein